MTDLYNEYRTIKTKYLTLLNNQHGGVDGYTIENPEHEDILLHCIDIFKRCVNYNINQDDINYIKATLPVIKQLETNHGLFSSGPTYKLAKMISEATIQHNGTLQINASFPDSTGKMAKILTKESLFIVTQRSNIIVNRK